MASQNSGPAEPRRATRWRALAGVIVGVLVVAAIVVVVVVSLNAGRTPAPVNAGGVVAPSAGPGEVLAPTQGPAVATGSPVASDPAQPDVQAPVPLTATATPVPGLTVTITQLSAITATASGVGETSGPALQFTVTATNTGADSIPLETAVVGVTYGQALTPANPVDSSATPLPAQVAAGQSVTGSYVFTVPDDQRDAVQITLDYRAGVPVIAFSGSAPR